ncbi:MAG: carbon monoxide dehydrogenase subunit G [Bauldia sp.]|nr:MAG: carbon monoxide dehydrogenase subunit G [Bauldia sp.]MBZ0229832.1 carbon monoxide dehydrogenase subunit G [Bauldia sp.]
MEMSGEYRIPAPREQVWAALNDPVVLKECIPGCQSLEKTSDTEMSAKVQAKVGPVKATFTGNVTLSDIDPPNGYTISGEGKGGIAGFAKGGADVKLANDGDGTVLTYTAKAQVGGKLAQVGARLIDATAKQMADQFFGAFAARLGAAQAEVAGPATLEDVIGDAEVTAAAVEERLELAAGRGFLGGPYVWGLLVLIAVIVLIMIFR